MNGSYENKNILVLGMARSGIAAAELLTKCGAHVTVTDQKAQDCFNGTLDRIFALGCENALGREVTEELLKGMDMMVISPGVPIDAPAVRMAEKMHVPVLGEMEAAYRTLPCPVVAVTGTNGKTTTVSLLGEMFEAAGRKCFVCGNIGYPVSAAAMECKKDDMIVAEVSSFQLETIECFHPVSAAVLNITEDHLNRHGTMEVYIGLKKHIFCNQTASDYAVLNDDDTLTRTITEGIKGHVALFSRKHEVPYGAFVREGQMIINITGKEETVCDVGDIYIPGPHNLENAMAASLLAASQGVPAPVIADVLRTFKGVEHRIEFTRELEGIRYINDSKGTNTDSTVKAVEAMTRPTTIILGGYDKHVSFVPLAECICHNQLIRNCVLIGVTAPQIEKALRNAGFSAIYHAASMKEAVDKSRALSGDGWNVLLSPACASFDMFEDYEQRGRVFKQIVNDLASGEV